MTFKRFNASTTGYYSSNYVGQNGELTWDNDNGLRLHDGNTNGGNPVGGSSYSGTTAIHDMVFGGSSSSADNGKFLQQYNNNNSQWAFVDKIDTADTPIYLEDQQTYSFSNVSGMVVITDQFNGYSYAYLCGGGLAVKLGGTNSAASPAPSDTCTITADGNYTLTNTSGSARNFGVAWVVTRHSY